MENEKDRRQKAENHASELEKKLAAETARADKAETQLALIDPRLPVEITATPITYDKPKAIIKLEFRNRSPKDFQFGFGPSKPQLVVPGYETSDIHNSIPGDCWNALPNCFDEFGSKYHAITLQLGENRVILFEFWLNHYDTEELSMLQKKEDRITGSNFGRETDGSALADAWKLKYRSLGISCDLGTLWAASAAEPLRDRRCTRGFGQPDDRRGQPSGFATGRMPNWPPGQGAIAERDKLGF